MLPNTHHAPTVASFIRERLNASGLSAHAVASAAGWESETILELIMEGRTKLPVNMVRPLAETLGLSAATLLRLVMQEYMPETYREVVQILDCDVLSAFERDALEAVRHVSRNGEHPICISRSERMVIVGLPSASTSAAGSPA